MHSVRRTLLALAVSAAVAGLPAGLDAATRLPDWAVTGPYDLQIPVGVGSVAGRYGFDLGDFTGNVSLRYEPKGRIAGGGSGGEFGQYLFPVEGTWDMDPATGRAAVRFANARKDPTFSFEGVLTEDRMALVGTYTRAPGFAGTDVTASGPLRVGRVPPEPASDSFRLRFQALQSLKGKVATARTTVVSAKPPLAPATLLVHGGELLDGGRVAGKLRTAADGTTTGKLTVRGKGWRVKLKGPVDAAGFHAIADVRTRLLRASGVAVTLPVQEGPEEPPPPPPPAPRNLLDGAVARVVNDQITITREDAPRKHFRKRADLTIQFPSSVGRGTVRATPATASGANPIRFFFAQSGGKTYGTATVPADVRLDVAQFSLAPGGTIEVHAVGDTYTPDGKRVQVDVIVLATVAP